MKTIKLKNRDDKFIIFDNAAYDAMRSDGYLTEIRMLNNLREHSGGYAVFQRCVTTKKGLVFETIYPHKWLAHKFVEQPKTDKRLFVHFKDGNRLNCAVSNLEWLTMSELRRKNRGTKGKTGYRGVTEEKGRFRAVLYKDRKAINLGFHDTAEEAALAYNKKSKELFGETASLNSL